MVSFWGGQFGVQGAVVCGSLAELFVGCAKTRFQVAGDVGLVHPHKVVRPYEATETGGQNVGRVLGVIKVRWGLLRFGPFWVLEADG